MTTTDVDRKPPQALDAYVDHLEALQVITEEFAASLGEEVPGPTSASEDPRLLSSTQTAALLSIHPSLVPRLARGGYLPYVRSVGKGGGSFGRFRFEPREMLEIANSGKLEDMLYWVRRHPELTPEEAFSMVSLEEACQNTGANPRVIMTLALNDQIRYTKRRRKGRDETLVHLGDLLGVLHQAMQ